MKNTILSFKDELFTTSFKELYSISKILDETDSSLLLVDSTSTRKDKLGEDFIYKMYETKYNIYLETLRFNYIVHINFNLLVSENVTTSMNFRFDRSTRNITSYSITSPSFGEHAIEIKIDKQHNVPRMEIRFLGTDYRILINHNTNEIIESNIDSEDKLNLAEFNFELNHMIESFKIKDKLTYSITLHRNLYKLYELFAEKILKVDISSISFQGKSYLKDLYTEDKHI